MQLVPARAPGTCLEAAWPDAERDEGVREMRRTGAPAERQEVPPVDLYEADGSTVVKVNG